MISESQEFARNIIRYISQLERQRRQYLDTNLKQYKLYGSMFMILLYTSRHPGSSQDSLTEFLGIDKSGVARKCRSLEDLGYVIREQSKEDRRQNMIYLTEKGTELLPIIRSNLSKWSASATKNMNEAVQKELIRLLELMMSNVLEA